jgi:flavodoxin
MKAVVVFYSQTCGNTRKIAEMIALTTGAALAEIKTVEDYGRDYDAVMVRARDEINSGFLPEIRPLSADLSEYDTVIIGTPTWWYTMAPAVRTYLNSQNWAGKTVVPFMTNAGWPGTVIHDMMDLCAGAFIRNPMEVKFDSDGGNILETDEEILNRWIAKLNG